MNSAQLIETWRGYLLAGAAGLHLADTGHPLQIFVGATDQGSPRLVIRTSAKPVTPSLSQVVLVERFEDKAGKWSLSFTLQDRKFDEVFLRLADDICTRSAQAPDEQSALDRIAVVLDEWRRLLKPRPAGLLTMEELRGLVGELWLLVDYFSQSRTMAEALAGWLGPMGLPQDFWYPASGYHEAKSIGPATGLIKISSENQLDADDLELHVLRVANSTPGGGATNLPELVGRVAQRLKVEGANSDELDERLERLGVVTAEPAYRDTWFVVAQQEIYAVTEEFPAVRASVLPVGVSKVRYQIDLASIEGFKTLLVKVD